MIVCKFGGSSTAHFEAIKNIKKIAKNEMRKVLVFSAIGKPDFGHKKLTDALFEKDFKTAKKYFAFLCKQTGVDFDSERYIDSIKYIYNNNNNNISWLVSRGEFATSLIMSKYLGIKFVPAEKIVFFDGENIDYAKTTKRIKYYTQKYKQIVIPGFYGIDEQNNVKLFSRGGGDVTGAIIAKCLCANVYENYTDVCGIKMANPNIVKRPRQIKSISYTDAIVMTGCDANVLHSDVCKILQKTNVVTKVKNVFSPNLKPTIIDNKKHKVQFVCFKKANDFVQVVAKTNNLNNLKRYYDYINYINKDFVYFCTDYANHKNLIKGIYKVIEKT